MVVALPFICELPVTISWAIVVVAKFELPLNVTLPLAISVARVEVLVTVRFAIVEVANCERPTTFRLLLSVVAPVMPNVPKIIWLPVVVALPAICKLPPKVTSPEPKVTGWLLRVLKLSVPEVKSKFVEPPVREMLEEAMVVVAPLISTFPPRVELPLTVSCAIVDVAKVDVPFTVSVELKVATPLAVSTVRVVEARLDVPLTVSWAMLVVAKVDVAATDNCPSNVSSPLKSALPTTANVTPGVVVPIPILPPEVTVK